MERSPLGDMQTLLRTAGGRFFPATVCSPPFTCLPSYRVNSVSGAPFDLHDHCARFPATLLTVCFSGYAEGQLESYRGTFLQTYPGVDLGIVDMRPLMSRLRWMIFSLLLKQTARTLVPPPLQSSYLIAYRPMALLDALGVPNYCGSFVYLMDRQGRVRWRGSGEATTEDWQSLNGTIRELIREGEQMPTAPVKGRKS